MKATLLIASFWLFVFAVVSRSFGASQQEAMFCILLSVLCYGFGAVIHAIEKKSN